MLVIDALNETSEIIAVYILASYTYRPIWGMFVFGIFTKKKVRDKFEPIVAILSPILYIIIRYKGWCKG